MDVEAFELYKDHLSLVKFHSEHDGDFCIVSGKLHVMARQAKATIEQRWNDHYKRM